MAASNLPSPFPSEFPQNLTPNTSSEFRQHNGRMIEDLCQLGDRIVRNSLLSQQVGREILATIEQSNRESRRNLLSLQLGSCEMTDAVHRFRCGAQGQVFDLETESVLCLGHFQEVCR